MSSVHLANLIEVLQEEREELGLTRLPEPLPESWSEAQIRHFFEAEQKRLKGSKKLILENFDACFPGLTRSGTKCASPKGFVLCFPPSGCAEDLFTSEGSGVRRASSPLLEYCKREGLWCLAVQPPGRGNRLRETPLKSALEIARRVQAALASQPELSELPYFLLSHSFGCWVSLELLRLRAEQGLSMPRAWCLSAMPAPSTPLEARPWTPNAGMSDAEFKQEVRAWDANEAVFQPDMWSMYEPVLRGDYTCFDTYPGCYPALMPSLSQVPLKLFHGAQDRRVTPALMAGWSDFSSASEGNQRIEGNHMFVLEKEAKAEWLSSVVQFFSSVGAGL